MRYVKIMRSIVLALIFLFLAGNLPVQAEVTDLTIFHTNDMHGYMLPQAGTPGTGETGGAANLATLIKKERKAHEGHFLLLDGGDTIQGTAYSYLSRGAVVIDVMNALHYDATVIGNHEFDWGKDAFMAVMKRIRFPMLGASVACAPGDNFLNGVLPYIVKDVSGMKVAIIGLTTTRTRTTAMPENTKGLKFLNPVDSCRKQLEAIKTHHPDVKFFIVLSHLGYIEDEELARTFPEIDVIVGGHSHTRMDPPLRIGKTIIVQAGCNLQSYGLLEMQVDTVTGDVTSYNEKNEYRKLSGEGIVPDPEIARIIREHVDSALPVMTRKIGTAAEDIKHYIKAADRRNTPMGDLVCDVMRQATGADAAFYTSSGIRSEFKKGPVTFDDVFLVIPYDFKVITLTVSGKDILRMLEAADKHAYFLQVSGITVDYTGTAPEWQRFSNIAVGGKPLDEKKMYRIALSDVTYNLFTYVRKGHDSGFLATASDPVAHLLLRDILLEYVKKHSPIRGKHEMRIRDIGNPQ